MNSPTKRSREEGVDEGDVRTTIDPVEFEWSAAEISKRPHLSIQEASKLMSLSSDILELGTAGTPRINWAADAVFRNEHLFRKICILGQFPPIVHMSLKRAFPRQYAKAHPKQDIFQWVWNELLAKVVQCVPWHSDALYEHGQTAGERFRDGFSMEKMALHITGGVLLEILQGENYSTAAAVADSKNRGSRDLDIFCTLASKEKQSPTWDWYQRFSGSVLMSGRHMEPPCVVIKRDQSPAFEYDSSISGCLFSQHVLDFGAYAPSAAGFQSICLTLLSPAISVPQYIRQYFDLNYCKNFLSGRGLVVMSPKSVLHKTHRCHDLTQYVNVRDTASHTGISRIAGRFLKYADRGYSIVASPSRPDYLASVIYQLIAALGGPHSLLKIDPKEWLDSGMEAALNSEYIRNINKQWVNFEKFVLFLNPKTAPIARIFLEEFHRSNSRDFPSPEEWIKPYAEWVQKLQDVDFSVLEPLLRKSLEKKNSSTPVTLNKPKNIRDLFKL